MGNLAIAVDGLIIYALTTHTEEFEDQRPGFGDAPQWLRDAQRVDEAIYAAIAVTPTPTLDRALGALARAADRSLIGSPSPR